MTAYCETFGIFLDLGIGVIFDKFGRRVPMAFAFLLSAVGMYIVPMFDEVYPWFLMSRILTSFSGITVNCPLIADYIDEGSQGLANGYFLMIVSVANILGSTVLL